MALLIANIGNVHRGVFSHGVFPIDRPAPSCRHKEKPQGKLPAFPAVEGTKVSLREARKRGSSCSIFGRFPLSLT